MRKLIGGILAAAMLCSVNANAVWAAADAPYTIYDLTFENGNDMDVNLKTEVAEGGRSSEHALRITPDEKGTVLRTALSSLQQKAETDISVWVKPEESDVTFKMIAYVTANGKESAYTLDSKPVSNNTYAKISGHINTRLINTDGDIVIGISAEKGGKQVGFLLDDFKVTSSKNTAESAVLPVPEIKYDGNLLKRASFETGTFEMFNLSSGCLFEITDKVKAHTGKYSMHCYDRDQSWEACRVYLNGVDPECKIKVSCWVKKSPSLASCDFRVQADIDAVGGKVWPYVSGYLTVTDDEWHYLEGTIDVSQYDVKGYVGFQISIGDTNFAEYWVDDLVVSGDKPGEFYDDMDYNPADRDPSLSDTPVAVSAFVKDVQQDIPSLKDVFKDYFKIGANLYGYRGAEMGANETRLNQLVTKHFNSVVSNGYFKMPLILTKGNRTDYDFSNGDWLMEFAQKNGIDDVVGHNLIWELSMTKPYTLDENGNYIDRDSLLAFMKEYITKVMKHYEGDGDPSEYQPGVDYSDWHIPVWDVVNEAVVEGNENYRHASGFFNILGKEYVNYAFQFADEVGYDDVKLRYNDFENYRSGKRDAVYILMKNLLDSGCRVDTLGIQSHLSVDVVPSQMRAAFEKYASLGVDFDITEFDISAYTTKQTAEKKALYDYGLPKEVEFAQAELAREMFNIFKEYSDKIDRVTFWSFFDSQTHLNNLGFGHVDFPGLFDRDYQAKPLYWAIVDEKYYYNNCLKEDTSVTRVAVDGVQLEFEDGEMFENGDTTYCEIEKLFDSIGVRFVKSKDKYAAIIADSYMEFGEGKAQIRGFKPYTMNNDIIIKDQKTYVPIMDICKMMGFDASFSDARNMINIASGTGGSGFAEAERD
ncbi:MAG: endo-1,4-beta-xylanase [Clostridiales bacterium]|nr:endo-1,4-beta-xylanase [Clostridiales bacterium]